MDPKQHEPEAKQQQQQQPEAPKAEAEVKANETTETEQPLREQPTSTLDRANQVIYHTDEHGVQHKICLPPPGTMRSAEPNAMDYTDDKGVKREIYLPQGTMHAAWDHLQNERWDELDKFEEYSKLFTYLGTYGCMHFGYTTLHYTALRYTPSTLPTLLNTSNEHPQHS